jgi:hypothetical protein
MKRLIVFLFVVSICSTVSAVNKEVVYDKDTKEVIGVKIRTQPARDASRVDIICEGAIVIYGATDKAVSISIDEKVIPKDLTGSKIDPDKKEISK